MCRLRDLILRRLLPAAMLDLAAQRASVKACLDEAALGIHYQRWAHLVVPASRRAFADHLCASAPSRCNANPNPNRKRD